MFPHSFRMMFVSKFLGGCNWKFVLLILPSRLRMYHRSQTVLNT